MKKNTPKGTPGIVRISSDPTDTTYERMRKQFKPKTVFVLGVLKNGSLLSESDWDGIIEWFNDKEGEFLGDVLIASSRGYRLIGFRSDVDASMFQLRWSDLVRDIWRFN